MSWQGNSKREVQCRSLAEASHGGNRPHVIYQSLLKALYSDLKPEEDAPYQTEDERNDEQEDENDDQNFCSLPRQDRYASES
jgi:hypothetical protein